MAYGSVAAKVRQSKERHPEHFCPVRNCLWRTMVANHATGEIKPAPRCENGYCPRHKHLAPKERVTQ